MKAKGIVTDAGKRVTYGKRGKPLNQLQALENAPAVATVGKKQENR